MGRLFYLPNVRSPEPPQNIGIRSVYGGSVCTGNGATIVVYGLTPGISYDFEYSIGPINFYILFNLTANNSGEISFLSYPFSGNPGTNLILSGYSITRRDTSEVLNVNWNSISFYILNRPSAQLLSPNSSICQPNGNFDLSISVVAVGSWYLVLQNGAIYLTGYGSGTFTKNVAPLVDTLYTLSSLQDNCNCYNNYGDLTGTTLITVYQMPQLVINNPAPVYEPSTIDLTLPSVTSGSNFPPNTTLSYWMDQAMTTPLTTPSVVSVGTVYWIKATNAGGYYTIQPVTVIINVIQAGLELVFDGTFPVANPSTLSQWNDFFNLPLNGTPFTRVNNVGNNITLVGGSGITARMGIFSSNIHLLSLSDSYGVIIAVNNSSFSGCQYCTIFYMPGLISMLGSSSFAYCIRCLEFNMPLLENTTTLAFANATCPTFYFPSLKNLALSCFQDCQMTVNFIFPQVTSCLMYSFLRCMSAENITMPLLQTMGASVSSDNVFYGIEGQTITLVTPSALMTNWGGGPDGDIINLQNWNTVTVVQIQ
jgi:hypothetical protein